MVGLIDTLTRYYGHAHILHMDIKEQYNLTLISHIAKHDKKSIYKPVRSLARLETGARNCSRRAPRYCLQTDTQGYFGSSRMKSGATSEVLIGQAD